MGFLSSIADIAATTATGGLNKVVGNGNGIGSLINNVTGVTNSMAQAQKYALQNAAVNNQYQKEFAKNAHQWEMNDLMAAGLNPALTATGGSGASASGGGSFGGGGGNAAGNPISMINELVGMVNQTSAVKSQNILNGAQATKALTENEHIPQRVKNEGIQAAAAMMNAEASATNAETMRQKARGGKGAEYLGTEATEGLLKLFGR